MRIANVLNTKARELGYSSYDAYLDLDDYWQMFSQRYIKSKCWCCHWNRQCSYYRKLLLHHITYERMGRELPRDVITVCDKCHKKIHQAINDGEAQLHNAHVFLALRLVEPVQQMSLTFDHPDSCNQSEVETEEVA